MSTILELIRSKNGRAGVIKTCATMEDLGVRVNVIYIDKDEKVFFGEANEVMIDEMKKIAERQF